MATVSLRVSEEWLAAVDREAAARQWSRNAAVVNLVWQVLADGGGNVAMPKVRVEAEKPEVLPLRDLPALAAVREKDGGFVGSVNQHHHPACKCGVCCPEKA